VNPASFDTSRTSASLLIRVRDPADHPAWNEFHERYAPMIRGWCRHWFPRETDDMVQEVLAVLVKRLQEFEYDPVKGRFRGYLKRVTNRLMADLKGRRPRPLPMSGNGLVEQVEAGEDLMDRLAREYDLELLEEAKKRVRACVELRTWSAYVETAERWRDPAEVARDLGMKVGAVYQAKHSVIKELRKEIEALQSRQ
jgi:RNA polymerase sigma-70 factor (ECF subfamily)